MGDAMRIFIDVGAHNGETLHVALHPKWGFDRVFALEPASACQKWLAGFRDPRLTVEPFGLGSASGKVKLHGAGLLGGSIYEDKRHRAVPQELLSTEEIELVRATDWFRTNVPRNAEVFLKLNCEGGEADILDDLLDSGCVEQLRSIYVDFDIRKVPSQAHRQQEIEERLRQDGVDYVTPDELGRNGHFAVAKWLTQTISPMRCSLADRLHHGLRLYAPPYERMAELASAVLPKSLYFWLGRRFGRVARSRRQA
jgi:FkbM family methyltransferase